MQEISRKRTEAFGLPIIVTFTALEEYTDPADHFEDPRNVEFACDGNPASWFCAKASAFLESAPEVRAETYLGCCSYQSFEEFLRPGDYASDMEHEVIQDLGRRILHLRGVLQQPSDVTNAQDAEKARRARKVLRQIPIGKRSMSRDLEACIEELREVLG